MVHLRFQAVSAELATPASPCLRMHALVVRDSQLPTPTSDAPLTINGAAGDFTVPVRSLQLVPSLTSGEAPAAAMPTSSQLVVLGWLCHPGNRQRPPACARNRQHSRPCRKEGHHTPSSGGPPIVKRHCTIGCAGQPLRPPMNCCAQRQPGVYACLLQRCLRATTRLLTAAEASPHTCVEHKRQTLRRCQTICATGQHEQHTPTIARPPLQCSPPTAASVHFLSAHTHQGCRVITYVAYHSRHTCMPFPQLEQ
jgi:hypothetical protein